MHAKLSGITCKKCSYKPIDRHDLKVHRKSTHASDDFMCGDCEYRAFRQQDLEKHFQRVHEKRRDHKCMYCDYAAFEKKVLLAHLNSIHSQKYPCKECSYKAQDEQDLHQHEMLAHETTGNEWHTTPGQEIRLSSGKADSCADLSTDEVWIKEESTDQASSNMELEDPLNITKSKDYRCPLCDFSAFESGKLRRHVRITHGTRKELKCGQCDYAARDKWVLKRHEKRIHERLRNARGDFQ